MPESSAISANRFWESVLSAAISQVLDPAPIRLTNGDSFCGRALLTAFRKDSTATLRLRTAIPRNAFLAACFDLTDHESREHLLVGFGVRRGSSTMVTRIVRCLGGSHSVSFPLELQREVAAFVRASHRNEALVFHNHPLNPLNTIFDNEPWASSQDRMVAMKHTAEPTMLVKTFTNGGRTRFYVAENGYVREFVGPDLLTLLKNLRPVR